MIRFVTKINGNKGTDSDVTRTNCGLLVHAKIGRKSAARTVRGKNFVRLKGEIIIAAVILMLTRTNVVAM